MPSSIELSELSSRSPIPPLVEVCVVVADSAVVIKALISAASAASAFCFISCYTLAAFVQSWVFVAIDYVIRLRILLGVAKRISKDVRAYFSKLGKKGGKKGGTMRAANMTPEQRSESARNAVVARWAKVKVPADSTD
jgi:hypothetical protein